MNMMFVRSSDWSEGWMVGWSDARSDGQTELTKNLLWTAVDSNEGLET